MCRQWKRNHFFFFFFVVHSKRTHDARFRSPHTSFEYVCRAAMCGHYYYICECPLSIARTMEYFSHGFWSVVSGATSRFEEFESISCELQCPPEMEMHEFMGQATPRHYFARIYLHRFLLCAFEPNQQQKNARRKIEWCVCSSSAPKSTRFKNKNRFAPPSSVVSIPMKFDFSIIPFGDSAHADEISKLKCFETNRETNEEREMKKMIRKNSHINRLHRLALHQCESSETARA